MRQIVRLFSLLLALSVLPGAAQSEQAGWTLKLSPVALTRIDTPRETRLMLCRVLPVWRTMGIAFWPGTPQYALAQDCRGGGRLVPVSPERLAAAQAAGLVPASVPSEPAHNIADMLAGVWGWIYLSVCFAILSVLQRWRRRVARFAQLDV